ncbi:hypothetical protein C8Q78DRAFT_980296 [Trametes maxima]|nr:hypothetical protein C8Q78DRAFT_980296 [Trametes maxima]
MSSSDDSDILQSIGGDIKRSFVAVIVETFLVAIYSVLALKTGRLVIRKNRTMVSVCTTLAVFVMFCMALSLWMIDIHNVVSELEVTLLSTSADSLEDRYSAATSQVLFLASVEDILYAYMMRISTDLAIHGHFLTSLYGIIIWRVYAFWSQGRERLILIIPLAFLLGSLAMSMSITYCATRLGADIVLGTFTHPAFCRNIQTASYSMTLATTGVATLLISYKAWQYRRIHFEAFGKLSRPTRVQRIMVMLIESGVLYMLFFLVQVVSSIASVNASIDRHPAISFGFTVYQFMTSLIVGMYPTVIVILMHSKHAFLRPGTTHGATSYTGDTRWHRDLDSSTRGVGSGFVSKGVGSGSSSHGTGSATVAGACRTYLNSTHARPTRPTAVVDLYEMAHRGSAGSLSAGSAGGHGKPRMSDVEGDGEKIVGGG